LKLTSSAGPLIDREDISETSGIIFEVFATAA